MSCGDVVSLAAPAGASDAPCRRWGDSSASSLGFRYRAPRRVGDQISEERAPHTAVPALWALHQKFGCSFEASVAVVDRPEVWRKGLEAAAIASYRQQYGESPTVNFGRITAGYSMSSNTAKLAAAGRRLHGGPSPDITENHNPSGVCVYKNHFEEHF